MEEWHGYLWSGWEIIRKIGSGSYGDVYEIHRRNGSYVEKAALKVISIPRTPAELEMLHMEGIRGENTREYLQRHVEEIRREIGLMQQLVGYSNIVSYEDYMIRERTDTVGWDILIRMELLTPLSDYLLQIPVSERDVLKIGLDISNALDICHGKKILHRDIKPQNIFRNEDGFYKLGDFGIARAMPGSESVMSFKGTVSYMAPETFHMHDTDARSDIYSLALVLYRILNGGREPFLTTSGFTPAEKEKAQWRRLHGETLPAPAGCSAAFWRVLSKALSPEPDNRYQTAAEFHKAFEMLKSHPERIPPDEQTVGVFEGLTEKPDSTGNRGSDAEKDSASNRAPAAEKDLASRRGSAHETEPFPPQKTGDGISQDGTGNPQRESGRKNRIPVWIAAALVFLAIVLLFVAFYRPDEGKKTISGDETPAKEETDPADAPVEEEASAPDSMTEEEADVINTLLEETDATGAEAISESADSSGIKPEESMEVTYTALLFTGNVIYLSRSP